MQVPFTNRSIKSINHIKPSTTKKREPFQKEKLSYFEKLKMMISRRNILDTVPEEQNKSRSRSGFFNRGLSQKKKFVPRGCSKPRYVLATQNSVCEDPKPLDKKQKKEMVNYNNKYQPLVDCECKVLQLKEVIGTGANASVRRAVGANHTYAIKIYEKYKLLDPAKLKSVFKQIKLMNKINHPDIVHLYGAHQNSKQIHVIMKYFQGKTLHQYLRENHFSLPLGEALRIVARLSGVLHYLHDEIQVAHRDLKLENILISPDLQSIGVIDFGYATSTVMHCESSCGTPNYMAPELFSKNTMYDAERVDMWAFGILIYHLVEGIFPFRGYDQKDLIRKIKQRQLKYKKTPKNLQAVIESLLQIDPSSRATAGMLRRIDWLEYCT